MHPRARGVDRQPPVDLPVHVSLRLQRGQDPIPRAVDVVAGELDGLHERVSGRFFRAEPRARVREYVSGLVAGLERKNGWTLAEHAGEVAPDGMQRLLRRADWDVDGVRDDLRGYVIDRFGDRGG